MHSIYIPEDFQWSYSGFHTEYIHWFSLNECLHSAKMIEIRMVMFLAFWQRVKMDYWVMKLSTFTFAVLLFCSRLPTVRNSSGPELFLVPRPFLVPRNRPGPEQVQSGDILEHINSTTTVTLELQKSDSGHWSSGKFRALNLNSEVREGQFSRLNLYYLENPVYRNSEIRFRALKFREVQGPEFEFWSSRMTVIKTESVLFRISSV